MVMGEGYHNPEIIIFLYVSQILEKYKWPMVLEVFLQWLFEKVNEYI